jgi:flagellum-specific ATP synthase
MLSAPLAAPDRQSDVDSLSRLRDLVDHYRRHGGGVRIGGLVTDVLSSHLQVAGLAPFVSLGDCVRIEDGARAFIAQVIRIDGDSVSVKPFESHTGVGAGAAVYRLGPFEISPDPSWKGRVIDALATPLDQGAALRMGSKPGAVDRAPPHAMGRARIDRPAPTGVCAIDVFTPLCRGQRIGVFAGSGVGKSTLLAMMSRSATFDTVVICLVGERGREVRDFLEEVLGDRAATAITVVATGDESPMMRQLAPLTAMSIAEFFRDRGESVLLVMDSVTRYAHALREIALAGGEPAVANGFTPSVFADLPRLLERAGPGNEGSGAITAIFAVLVDADNHNDPIADCIRGTLDGHIVLDREIAEQGRYPAINVLKSISRLADRVWSVDQRALISRCRAMIARYEDTKDLRLLGGYQAGADPGLDRAVEMTPKLYAWLEQNPQDPPHPNALAELAERFSSI